MGQTLAEELRAKTQQVRDAEFTATVSTALLNLEQRLRDAAAEGRDRLRIMALDEKRDGSSLSCPADIRADSPAMTVCNELMKFGFNYRRGRGEAIIIVDGYEPGDLGDRHLWVKW